MRTLNSFINEAYINEASKEDKNFENVPVKELYKGIINGIKRWATVYAHPGYEDLDPEKLSKKGLLLLAYHASVEGIPQYEIKGQKLDYSKTVEALTSLFTDNWDDTNVTAVREVSKDSLGIRYYTWKIEIDGKKLEMHTGVGPMTNLMKYKVK